MSLPCLQSESTNILKKSKDASLSENFLYLQPFSFNSVLTHTTSLRNNKSTCSFQHAILSLASVTCVCFRLHHLNAPLLTLFAGASLRFQFRCPFWEALSKTPSAPTPNLREVLLLGLSKGPSTPCGIPSTPNYNHLVLCHSLPTGCL